MRSWRRGLVLLGLASILVALWATGCEDPVAAFTGITSQSDVVNEHSHRVTIPARDIEQPPESGQTYETSQAGTTPHAHLVVLSQANLQDLNQKGALVIVPTELSQGHRHWFDLTR